MTPSAHIFALAHNVLGNKAQTWLHTPQEQFGWASPQELLSTGGKRNVERVLNHLQGLSTAAAVKRTQAAQEAAQEQGGLF